MPPNIHLALCFYSNPSLLSIPYASPHSLSLEHLHVEPIVRRLPINTSAAPTYIYLYIFKFSHKVSAIPLTPGPLGFHRQGGKCPT